MNPEFDGDLILLIDHINLIQDVEKDIENNLKFWIPQQTPQWVKLILTMEEKSFNLNYFSNLNSPFIYIKKENPFKIVDSQPDIE